MQNVLIQMVLLISEFEANPPKHGRVTTREEASGDQITFLGTALPKATPGVEQKSPMFTPGVANEDLSLATAMSQLATSWHPAAVAKPFTMAITGTGWFWISIMTWRSKHNQFTSIQEWGATLMFTSCDCTSEHFSSPLVYQILWKGQKQAQRELALNIDCGPDCAIWLLRSPGGRNTKLQLRHKAQGEGTGLRPQEPQVVAMGSECTHLSGLPFQLLPQKPYKRTKLILSLQNK